MKILNLIQFVLITSLLICYPNKIKAQVGFSAEYNFEDDLTDESGLFEATILDSISYAESNDGKALYLQGENCLKFPMALNDSVQLDKSFHIEMSFLYNLVPEEVSERVLIGNKDHGYDTPGFHVFLNNEYHDDTEFAYAVFNIGGGNGKSIAQRIYDLAVGKWHQMALTFDFADSTYTFRMNGSSISGSLLIDLNDFDFDPQPFFDSFSKMEIFVGAHAPSEPGGNPQYAVSEPGDSVANADIMIDNLKISSPKPDGSTDEVVSVLDQFSNELEGITDPLDNATQEVLLAKLRSNLLGSDLNASINSLKRFISAFENNHALIFTKEASINYVDMDNHSQAYIEVGNWLMKEGYKTEYLPLLEGVTFREHEWFPGAVAEGAERVSNETVSVNATFIRDPGYSMMGFVKSESELSSYLFRSTGFYAAAGEPVTITVDESLVNTGLHIRVGAHISDFSSWSQSNRMPLIFVDYRIDSTETKVINPFGGGIYVLVPQATDLGWVDINISGAVRAPFYSYRTGKQTTLAEWEAMKSYPAPFADFESDKYMLTVWTKDIQSFDQPDSLMQKWNQVMDIYSKIFGRPLERARAEAFLMDSKNSSIGSFPAGYPQTPGFYAREMGSITNGTFSPFNVLTDKIWERNDGFFAMYHEMGHTHLPPTLTYEVEVIVNVPAAAILTELFGLNYDEALKWSGFQKFTRDDAAIDWMVSENFRNGRSIGFDLGRGELQYQARGYAKYLDIAEIFGGWEAMGKIYKTFYDEQIASGIPQTISNQPIITRDHFIRNGSDALGYNIAPLMHFWGIQPSQELIEELADYPKSEEMKERINRYWHQAPKNNVKLSEFYNAKVAVDQGQLNSEYYEQLISVYDETHVKQIQNTIDEILTIYYDAITNVEEEELTALPKKFDLQQNYPNPFNPSTKIKYSLPETANVSMKLYDLLGREVVVLINKKKPAGNYEITFDATSLPSGIYIYRLKAGDFNVAKKMILLK